MPFVKMMLKASHIFNSSVWKHIKVCSRKKYVNLFPMISVVNCIHTGKFLKGKAQSSALYVSGSRAQTVFGVLSPYLDISKTLQNISALEYNIKLRGMNQDIKHLLQLWQELQHLQSCKIKLEEERTTIANTMKSLAKEKQDNVRDKMNEWKERGKEVREELKAVTKKVGDVEDILVLSFLELPNKLHHSVGYEDKVLMSLFGKPTFEQQTKGHEELGKLSDELEFLDCSPTAYYLKNKLALLELSCSEYFTSLLHTHGYLQHANPDFAKGVVVEGSGIHISEIEKVLMLSSHKSDSDKNSKYLVGGGSLQAFASFFTKQVINDPECLPLKLVTNGRSYLPSSDTYSGLFNCWQSTVVDSFVVFENNPAVQEQMLNEILMVLVQSYTQLKIHFQVKRYAAHNLEAHESTAIGILMFSPKMEMYHEVGRISVCGDFISKRLLALHKVTNNSASFLSMIHVRVCNITHLLAFIMENGQNESGSYHIPDCLRKLMYI